MNRTFNNSLRLIAQLQTAKLMKRALISSDDECYFSTHAQVNGGHEKFCRNDLAHRAYFCPQVLSSLSH